MTSSVDIAPPIARKTASFVAATSILALILREMSTRYGRTPGGYIWAVLEPLGFILVLGIAWSLLARTPSLGTSFILFKATGMLALQMFTVTAGTVGKSMQYSKPLLNYPRVTWIDTIIARFILNALVITTVSILILTGIMIYEDIRNPLLWGHIVLAMTTAAAMGLGWGVLNCYLFQRIPVWEQLWAIITRPLFLVSGIIFLYEELPAMAKAVLWYNPLLHITGIMREGFYPLYRPDYISVAYIMAWTLVPMCFGLLLLRSYSRDLLNK